MGRYWIHYDMGKPISIIAGYFNDETTRTVYLSMLAVAEEYQGKRLASSLLSEFEDYAIKNKMNYVKLEVRKHNLVARKLYSKFGYKVIGDASDTSYYMLKKLENLSGGGTELYQFLTRIDNLFPISLSDKESLSVLSSKLEKYGTISYVKRTESWIVAMCAGYANDLQKSTWITSR